MTKLITDGLSPREIKERLALLHTGDRVFLTGTVYTSRDAAHKRIFGLLNDGNPLPYPLEGAFIYYAGPTPAKNGLAVGACGPTTSSRMDTFAPRLYDLGVAATIGKGDRAHEVAEACKRNGSVYLCAIGGAGALASGCIKQCEVKAFEDLGCESVKKLRFEDFPLTVATDSRGNDLFERIHTL